MARQIVQHFKPKEFKCRCGRSECDAPQMDMEHMLKLEGLRREWGEPMLCTSGSRCVFWNAHVGGALLSQHVKGKASDWQMPKARQERFVELAKKHGFTGIGIADTFVHLDTRPGPRRVWSYPPRK